MLDFRVKKPKSALNWRYQEIIVDQAYIDAGHGMIVTLDAPYEMGLKALDVFYNGVRLSEGGGYEEVDQYHIRLDIRQYNEDGTYTQLEHLHVGDEIIVKEWFNSSSILYGQQGFNSRLTKLEQEIAVARGGFPVLSDRLNTIDKEIANLIGEGNYTIDYIYDSNDEDIIREEVTGDYTLTREMVYNSLGKPEQEIIWHGNKKTTRQFVYDPDTFKIVKVISTTVTV